MSSPLLQPLTVVYVSPSGRPPDDGTPLNEVDPALDVEIVEVTDQALDRIDEDEVDCVVVEHGPPRVDGIGFVAAVREQDAELPVLVLPLEGAEECTRAALVAGATDVVQTSPQSLSVAVLANRIRQFVRSSNVDRDVQPVSPHTTGSLDDSASDEPAPDAIFAQLNVAAQEFRHAGQEDTVADLLADVTAEVLDVPGVAVFRFDDERNHLRSVAITDTMVEYYGGETVFGPGKPDSITWRVFVTGEPLLFDDIRTSDSHVNEATDARSSIFVPLGEHGVLVAATDVVGAFSETTHQCTGLLAAMAESAFDRIESGAVVRQRERRIREQDSRLQRFDRLNELICSVDAALVDETTREDLEVAVLDELVGDDWFDFAWIGTVDADTGRLTPREWTGSGNQYLDDLSLTVDGCDEPACRTAREWEVTAAPNVAEDLDGDGWQRNALSRDFHSVLSVPIAYEGVLYGVLTVYADRPDAFQEPIASVLEQIGKTTAYAISATEHRHCLLSREVTELELRIDDPDGLLSVIAESIGTPIECLESTPLSDGSTKILFSASDVSAETVLARTAGLVAVDSVTHVAGNDGHVFSAVVTGEMVGSVLASSGGIPEEILADSSSLDVTVNLPDTVDVRTFVDRIERRYPDVQLVSRRERDQSSLTRVGFLDELATVLTDRQMDVLRTAYENDFFQSPRGATGQDVADELDVSQPTVSHHLRTGQGKLFSLLFGDR